jgi:hypothetical protein
MPIGRIRLLGAGLVALGACIVAAPAMAGVNPEGDLGLVYEGTTTNMAAAGPTSESSYHDCKFETPSGTKLLGGGIFFQNAGYGAVRAVSSSPFDGSDDGSVPEAWYVTGANGSTSTTISLGEAEVCGQVKRISYPSHTKEIPTTEKTAVNASCPDRKHVLGGGPEADAPDSVRITSTAPFDSGDADHRPDDGWRGTVSNGTDSPLEVTTTAICARLKGLTYRTKSKTVNGASRATQPVHCPQDKLVVGGGVSQNGPYFVEGLVRSSFDFADHGKWVGTVDNYQVGAETMKVTAICHS